MTSVFILLLIKHTFCDLFMQSTRPSADKSNLFNRGLHRHCLDHAILTLVILLFFTSFKIALLLALLDYVAHCNIDWTKYNIIKKYNVIRNSRTFWAIQSADQSLHYITYYIIVLLIGTH